jgi:hypothetical protein
LFICQAAHAQLIEQCLDRIRLPRGDLARFRAADEYRDNVDVIALEPFAQLFRRTL